MGWFFSANRVLQDSPSCSFFSVHSSSDIYAFGRCETVPKSPSFKKQRLYKKLFICYIDQQKLYHLLFNADLGDKIPSYSPYAHVHPGTFSSDNHIYQYKQTKVTFFLNEPSAFQLGTFLECLVLPLPSTTFGWKEEHNARTVHPFPPHFWHRFTIRFLIIHISTTSLHSIFHSLRLTVSQSPLFLMSLSLQLAGR